MVWNSYTPLSYDQYLSIVPNGPLHNQQAYSGLISAAQSRNRDPRALLTELKYENNFGLNISQSQLANNNYAGIKYAGQNGASPGGTSPEGDQYAHFNSIGAFMDALAVSLPWYVSTFPARLGYYLSLVTGYPAMSSGIPSQSNGGVTASGGNTSGGNSGPFGLPTPGDIAGAVASGVSDALGNVGNSVSKGVGDALGNVVGGVTNRMGTIIKSILSSDLMERGLMIGIGIIMVIAGINGLTHLGDTAVKVAGTAAVAAA